MDDRKPDTEPAEANEAEQPPKRKRHRLRRWLIGTFLFILVLFGGVQVALRYYADEIIGTIFKSVVSIQSDGLYYMEYDEMQIDLVKRRLFVRGLSLNIDTARFEVLRNQGSIHRDLNTIYIPKLEVKDNGLSSIHLTRNLQLSNISIYDPEVLIWHYDTLRDEKKFQALDLYPLISGYLDLFTVDHFELINASVVYQDDTRPSAPFALHHINTVANGIRIDSTVYGEEGLPLHVDDLELNIKGNWFEQKAWPYRFAFDRVRVRTNKNEVNINGVRIRPQDPKDGKFWLKMPAFRLEGVDLRKAYLEKVLEIDRIAVRSGEAILKVDGNSGDAVYNFDPVGIYEQISPFFHYVFIKEVAVNKGNLELRVKQGENKQKRISLPSVAILARHVLIDSMAAIKRGQQFFTEDVELTLRNVDLPIAQGKEHLSVQELGVSTADSRLYANGLRVRSKQRNTGSGFDLRIPGLLADGIDVWKLYLQKELDVRELTLNRPKLNLHAQKSREEEKHRVDLWNLYPLISEDLVAMRVDKLKLREATLDLTQQKQKRTALLNLQGITIDLDRFLLDSTSQYNTRKLFYADQFRANARDLSFLLADSTHVLRVKDVRGSSRSGDLKVEAVAVRPRIPLGDSLWGDGPDVPWVVDLDLQSLEMADIDYQKAYYEGDYRIGQFNARRPEVKIYRNPLFEETHPQFRLNRKQRMEEKMRWLQEFTAGAAFGGLIMDSLDLSYYEAFDASTPRFEVENLEICTENTLLDTVALNDGRLRFDSDDVDFYAQSMKYRLTDEWHSLHLEHFTGNEVNRYFRAEKLLFKPKQKYGNLGKQNIYDIALPGIQMKNIGIQQAILDGELLLDSLLIEPPTAEFLLFSKEEQQARPALNNVLINRVLENVFSKLEIKSTTFQKADLHIINDQSGKAGRWTTPNGSLAITDFKWGKGDSASNSFLYADDVSLLLKKVEQVFPDSLYKLAIGNLEFSTGKKRIAVDSVRYWPREGLEEAIANQDAGQNALLDIMLPHAHIDGLNIPALLEDSSLFAAEISLDEPLLRLFTAAKEEPSGGFSLPEQWYDLMKPYLKTTEVGRFRLKDAGVDLLQEIADGVEEQCVYNLGSRIDSFRLDSAAKHTPSSLLFAQSSTFSIHDYTLPLPNGLFDLELGKVRFDLSEGKMTATSTSLIPYTSKYKFAEPLGYESDWMNMHNRSFSMSGIDVYRLISEGALHATNTNLSGLDLQVFRDKRLPFPKDQHPRSPQEVIMQLGFPLTLDTVRLQSADISYQEFAEKGVKEGTIQFLSLNAEATNITNEKRLLEPDLKTRIKADALLMGQGLITGTFDFDLDDPNGSYIYDGTVYPMEVTHLNPMLEHVAFVRIDKGRVRKLDVSVSANNQYATGRMLFRYNNLEVSFLNRQTQRVTFQERISGILANTFVLHANNPKFLIPRKGNIYFERDTTRSIFNYWSYTVFNGLQNSVGSRLVKTNSKKKQRVQIREARKKFLRDKRAQRKQLKKEERLRKKQAKQTAASAAAATPVANSPPKGTKPPPEVE